MSQFNTVGDPAERREKVARYFEQVEKLAEGKDSGALPWHDTDFQRVVIETLRREMKWRDDSRKLAIIKEVFGGNKA